MVGDHLARRQIARYGIEQKGRIDRLYQSFVQEQILVEGIFPFFVKLCEPGFSIQIVE